MAGLKDVYSVGCPSPCCRLGALIFFVPEGPSNVTAEQGFFQAPAHGEVETASFRSQTAAAPIAKNSSLDGSI